MEYVTSFVLKWSEMLMLRGAFKKLPWREVSQLMMLEKGLVLM